MIDWLVRQDRNAVFAIGVIAGGFCLLFAATWFGGVLHPKHHCDYDCQQIVNQYGPLFEATPQPFDPNRFIQTVTQGQ